MKKYSITLSTHLTDETLIDVYELCKSGESLFEKFVQEIEDNANLFGFLVRAIRIIEGSANLLRFPKNKFREIEGHNLKCKVYEAKAGALRTYLFHREKTGRIIVSGGIKKDQKQDIKNTIRTIKEYFDEQEDE